MKRIVVYIFTLLFLSNSCVNKSEVTITRVYEGDNGRAVYFDTKEKAGNLLISNSQFIYGILDKTENNAWIIVEQAPFSAGPGRVATELQLYNIPESKQIILEDIDPSYSLYGSTFEKKDGIDCLTITFSDGVTEISVPLTDLLEKAKSVVTENIEMITETKEGIQQGTAAGSVSETGLKSVVLLKIGTAEDQIGQGMAEQQLEGGRFNYAVPSFAVFENQIFIVDAINFRVLVYDYSGNSVRIISYPEKSEDGSVNVIRDICVDKGVLYLSSFYAGAVYVIDSETEDVIEIITGSDTENKKFESIELLALDNEKNLLIPDTWDNSLNFYRKGEGGMKLLKAIPYTGKEQLAFDTGGNSYSTVTKGQEVTVTDSQGKALASFMHKSPAGSSCIIDIDDNNIFYIQTIESETPDVQFYTASCVKVIQQDGTVLNDYSVPAWPNGPMTKHIVVDAQGTIFVATYDFKGTELPDDPPTGILISRVN